MLLDWQVTNIAFEAFRCHEFADGRGWLVADTTIECRTEEHDNAQRLAWAAVFLYPIGLWLLTLWLISRAASAITSRQPSTLSDAISFLHHEYEPTMRFWELMEVPITVCL